MVNSDTINAINNSSEHRIQLAVVMPAYNEAENIEANLLETSRVLNTFAESYEILAVNDGSTDKTMANIKLATLKDSHIKLVNHEPNKGKGYSIRHGVSCVKNAEYIAFLDSDLELPPTMLKNFLEQMQKVDADIAIGSKMHKESNLKYPLTRRIMSVGYYTLLKLMFHMKIKDTQTGIKLFKSSVIKPICEGLSTNGYAFDIEILATATKMGYSIIEMPIELVFKRDRRQKSRFTLKTVYTIFKETMKIKKSLKKRFKK